MQSFSKVLSCVPKKFRRRPVVGSRILIAVDSREFVLGNLRIATVEIAAGQCRSQLNRGAITGSRRSAVGRRGNLIKLCRWRVPGGSGRTIVPCSELLGYRCRPDCKGRRKTKLGFVNLWSVNSLKGISASRDFCGRR